MSTFVKICLLTAEYPPDVGGVGDYTRRLGEALAALGAGVEVLTGRGVGRAGGFPALPESRPPDQPPVRRWVPSWGWRGRRALIAALRELAPDVVNIQYQTAAYGMRPTINLLPLTLRR